MADEESTAQQEEATEEAAPRTFTQEELDKTIERRLKREREKFAGFEKFKADSEELAKLREESKSDLDKANDRAERAEKELAEMRAQRDIADWKKEVAEETGVPADVLRGASREEIEAHAKQLAPHFKKKAPIVFSDGQRPETLGGISTTEQFARTLDRLL